MSAIKHTPGPWIAKKMRSGTGNFEIDSVDGYYIAESIGGMGIDEEEANACLIAAAPELLGALRSCVMVMERDLSGLQLIQPELKEARAAIAKAEGQS